MGTSIRVDIVQGANLRCDVLDTGAHAQKHHTNQSQQEGDGDAGQHHDGCRLCGACAVAAPAGACTAAIPGAPAAAAGPLLGRPLLLTHRWVETSAVVARLDLQGRQETVFCTLLLVSKQRRLGEGRTYPWYLQLVCCFQRS